VIDARVSFWSTGGTSRNGAVVKAPDITLRRVVWNENRNTECAFVVVGSNPQYILNRENHCGDRQNAMNKRVVENAIVIVFAAGQ